MIKVGDIVKLNSGGPKMTVNCVIEWANPNAICVWVDTTGHSQENTFDLRVLKRVQK